MGEKLMYYSCGIFWWMNTWMKKWTAPHAWNGQFVGQNGNCRVVLVVTNWAVPLCLPYYRPKREKGLWGPPLLILIYPKKQTHFEVGIYSFSFGFNFLRK
jgi:hypothetical protein